MSVHAIGSAFVKVYDKKEDDKESHPLFSKYFISLKKFVKPGLWNQFRKNKTEYKRFLICMKTLSPRSDNNEDHLSCSVVHKCKTADKEFPLNKSSLTLVISKIRSRGCHI